MFLTDFSIFFSKALARPPFGFQKRFAHDLPALVDVPTGLGKTAMVILGWLWRRNCGNENISKQTPRRLVYCLPMRVLVEQTRNNAIRWLIELRKTNLLKRDVPVHVLMGGEDEDDWDIYPEHDAIIIGTQDMLLSRALNRGYAASRSRWPIQFGLLHTDCLWVFDEIQLMGSGLATTAQLEAFRRQLAGDDGPEDNGCKSVWMSATLRPDWLRTVDFKGRIDDQGRIDGEAPLSLSDADHKDTQVAARWNAKKPLSQAESVIDPKGSKSLAGEVVKAHDKSKGRTIVVVNTVKRACELWAEIKKQWSSATDDNLVLLHSRFRPSDRATQIGKLRPDVSPEDLPPDGMIVVSTQVIEAGVDVSAATLFTELAPWASLVQRFGRCNRRGECDNKDGSTHASVHWIDVADKDAAPYEADDLKDARDQLDAIEEKPKAERNVGPRWLPSVPLKYKHTHVIRRKDLIDLFDTTQDLAGNDIDIDRFVREVEETDVRVFWRVWDRPKGHEPPPEDEPAPRRKELCPVPIGSEKNPGFRQFAAKHKGKVWRWSFLDKKWEKAGADRIAPGQVFLIHADAGGYSPERGWNSALTIRVEPIVIPADAKGKTPDATDEDAPSQIGVWQTIAIHTNDVSRELDDILNALRLGDGQRHVLRAAARWHDWGKAHPVFQNAIDDGQTVQRQRGTVTRRARPEGWNSNRAVAKAPGRQWCNGQFADAGWWRRYDWPDGGRRHFRHELVSALAVLQRPHVSLRELSDEDLNLVAYLIAAHHGKVRLSIRSLPNELRPRHENGNSAPQKRFARGVWDGDILGVKNGDKYAPVDLGGDILAPAVTLSLEPMELGLCEGKPLACFKDQSSWAERMIRLRDTLGPFRLAYLEAILRAADMRASANAQKRGTTQ